MVYPARKIIDMVFKHNTNPVFYCYDVVTIAGAVAAAYSLQYFRKDTVRPFLLCLATAGAIAISFMVGGSAVRSILTHQALNFNVLTGLHSLLTYFPVSFMIEEVTFRGMLDGHLYRPGETKDMWPAIFVSALWGVWHFPIISLGTNKNALITGAIIIAFHTLVGVPLSIFWRRSGNLAVTSFTHAFIDAVRNALLAGV
jgi:membrane protease YdiL (CAAX protease family)